MKKIKYIVLSLLMLTLVGCSKASRISYNISREADEFNITRKITVFNGITGDIQYQMTGRMSIDPDVDDGRLEVVAMDDEGNYRKHFIGLSDNINYIVEDVTGQKGIDDKYRIYFNPEMIIPVEVKLAE